MLPSDVASELRASVARRLERGVRGGLLLRALSRSWGAFAARRLARPLKLPPGASIVAVGGAVLGGAGKTPVAIALARALSRSGEAVVLVSHGYRAPRGAPRVVSPEDTAARVGDDALAAARALAPDAIPVVSCRHRQAAIDLASTLGTRLVVDGLLQASPAPVHDAVLVLDAESPWGSGACPPVGDLRAPEAALLAAADHVVLIVGAWSKELPGTIPLPSVLDGATSPLVGWFDLRALRRLRLGLLVAVARPLRVKRALDEVGITPVASVFLADHAVPSRRELERAARLDVDAWLTTSRCAPKLPGAIAGAPVLALAHRVDVTALLPRLRPAPQRTGHLPAQT